MMVRGIFLSKSVNLASIARELEVHSTTSSRHIFKRLDRNLGQGDIMQIKQACQKKQGALIDDETFIYFDPTEVIKVYAKKMEAMGYVADGSNGHKPKPGYHVNACIGLRGNEIIPLEWNVYSSAEESFISSNDAYLRSIDTIAHASHLKGIFVMDREFDRFAVIRHMTQLGLTYIIRMTEKRHYYPLVEGAKNKAIPRHEAIKHYAQVKASAFIDIRARKSTAIQKRKFTIKAVPVKLTTGIDSQKTLTLIRAHSQGLTTLYFLTDIDNITSESLVSIVEGYLGRWKIEEFIRFVKQHYHLEDFRVRSLGRIKNLFHIVFIAMVVLTRVADQKPLFSKARSLLIRHAKRVFPIPQKMKFFLYTLADGLSNLLRKITKPLLHLWSIKQSRQLYLPFQELL